MRCLFIKLVHVFHRPFRRLLMGSPIKSAIVLKIISVIDLTLHQIGQSVDVCYVSLWFFYEFHLVNWVLLDWRLWNITSVFYGFLHCIWDKRFIFDSLFELVFKLKNPGLILGYFTLFFVCSDRLLYFKGLMKHLFPVRKRWVFLERKLLLCGMRLTFIQVSFERILNAIFLINLFDIA